MTQTDTALPYQNSIDFLVKMFDGTEHDIEVRSLSNDGRSAPRFLHTRDMEKVRAFLKCWDKPGRGMFFVLGFGCFVITFPLCSTT